MPRTGRGGSRQGAVGTAYGNRTDLNNSLPVSVAQNQEYGRAAEQRAAQLAVPMAGTQTPPAQAPAQSQTLLGNMPTQSAGAPMIKPGTAPFLHPTNRPDEPITAGLPTGPGPGPEALRAMPQPAQVGETLSALASLPNASSAIADLAASARLLGL